MPLWAKVCAVCVASLIPLLPLDPWFFRTGCGEYNRSLDLEMEIFRYKPESTEKALRLARSANKEVSDFLVACVCVGPDFPNGYCFYGFPQSCQRARVPKKAGCSENTCVVGGPFTICREDAYGSW